MPALSEFADEIVALEQLGGGQNALAQYDDMQRSFAVLLSRIENGKIDDAVPDEIWTKLEADLWAHMGSHLMEREKEALPIRLRLTRFYEQLVGATQDEWEAYTNLLIHARVVEFKRAWPQLMQRMSEEHQEQETFLRDIDVRLKQLKSDSTRPLRP